MTHWKSVPKIDGHIHILPDAVIEANPGSDDPFIAAGGVDSYLRLMDENHIEKAVIMPFNDPFLMSMEFSLTAVHNNMLDFSHRYPGRFLLFADIDPRLSPEENIAELRRIMSTGAFSGIKLHPANTGLPMDGDYYDAILSYAENNSIPVEIHCYPREHDSADLCAPARLRRVMARHPTLRLCAAHLGGFQFEALCGLDIYADISAILPELAARLGVDEAGRILRAFSRDKLIFATDYPDSRSLSFERIYPQHFEILDAMGFSEEEIRAIGHDNLLRFLNIES